MTEKSCEYIERIDKEMLSFMDRYGIDDLRDLSMSRWYACLKWVNSHVFRDVVGKNILDYSDCALISDILDKYILLCQLNEKDITIDGFLSLLGVSYGNIKRLGDMMGSYSETYVSNIRAAREAGIAGRLYDGVKNPLGLMAIANRFFGWDKTRIETDNNQVSLSNSDIAAALGGPDASGPVLPDDVGGKD